MDSNHQIQPVVQASPQQKPPWNPLAILFIGIFFSFFPAGIMNAINWERFGHPEKKKSMIIFTIVLFVIFAPVAYILAGSEYSRMLMPTYFFMSWMFYSNQKKIFKEHVAKGGARGSVGKPILLSFLFAVAYVAVVVGASYVGSLTEQNTQLEAGLLMLGGKYEEARPKLEKLLKAEPKDRDVNIMLARIYLLSGDLDKAMERFDVVKTIKTDVKDEEEKELEKDIGEAQKDPEKYKMESEINRALMGGGYFDAEPLLYAFKSKYPESPTAYLGLAFAYENTKRTSLAVKELEALLKIDPNNEMVKGQIKNLKEELQPDKIE